MKIRPESQKPTTPERPEIEYPCIWIYTVIGEDKALLKEVIVTACAPEEVTISHSKSSSGGKYHSLNARLNVKDEKTRLTIFQALKCHPTVKLVL